MEADSANLLWLAAGIGALSAASLPLGSVVGLMARPRASVSAVLAAFGAGALIAALAVDLVAPRALAVSEHGGALDLVLLLMGAIVGGLIFVILDRALAMRGGFLRKVSTTIAYLTQSERQRQRETIEDLCAIPLLRALPVERVQDLIGEVHLMTYSRGERLFAEGDAAGALFFVRRGRIALDRGGEALEPVGVGGILGELSLVTGLPRSATALADGDVEVYSLDRAGFDRLRQQCPEFDRGVRGLAGDRLAEIRERDRVKSAVEECWGAAAIEALRGGGQVPSPPRFRELARQHSGAALAVWLGMLIDGIPESIVIGSEFRSLVAEQQIREGAFSLVGVIPYTFVAGLFLSNFPEALSSSVGMREQGWAPARVLGLWSSLFVLTAVGSGAGYAIGEAVSHSVLVTVEGLAAGAMLTAIASTMIPEAVHLSGSSSRAGLATLLGFVAAVSFKLLE